MKKNYYLATLAALAILVAPLAYASEDVKVDDGSPEVPGIQAGPNCDLTGYKSEVQNFTPPAVIPDNNAAGAVYGPIVMANDGTRFLDLIVGLNITHTWVGDLKVYIRYDEGCDGSIEAADTLLCRPGSTSCPGTAVGCSSNLVAANTYNFSETATVVLNPATCATGTNLAGGCYLPSGAIDRHLKNFNGRNKGGCFTLFISDNAAQDTGTLTGWQIHTLNERPVPTENVTWTAIKAMHR